MTKAKDVTAAVQEIIGLDYNQFCQIAMIAQGQFTKLLNASTEERSRIFRKLFRESARHAGDAAQLDVLAGQVTQAQTALAATMSWIPCAISSRPRGMLPSWPLPRPKAKRTQLAALDTALAAAEKELTALEDAPTRLLALQNREKSWPSAAPPLPP